MVVSTGDELIEPGRPIEEHQVRRSNAYAVVAALRRRGFEHVNNDHILDNEGMCRIGWRDISPSGRPDPERRGLQGKIRPGPKALKSLGVEEVFHQVAQRRACRCGSG